MKALSIAVAVLALLTLPATSAAQHSGAVTLKQCIGAPPKLKAGTYRTRAGFVPVTTFRVPVGWYGCQGSSTNWTTGRDIDTAAERLNAELDVDVLRLSFAKAVAKFKALKILVAGPSTKTRVGGFSGVTFHAKVKGSDAPLTALGTDADIQGDETGQQTFLNVRGKTLLLRIGFAPRSTASARNQTQQMVRTIAFPR